MEIKCAVLPEANVTAKPPAEQEGEREEEEEKIRNKTETTNKHKIIIGIENKQSPEAQLKL